MRTLRRHAASLALAAALPLALVACGDDDPADTGDSATEDMDDDMTEDIDDMTEDMDEEMTDEEEMDDEMTDDDMTEEG